MSPATLPTRADTSHPTGQRSLGRFSVFPAPVSDIAFTPGAGGFRSAQSTNAQPDGKGAPGKGGRRLLGASWPAAHATGRTIGRHPVMLTCRRTCVAYDAAVRSCVQQPSYMRPWQAIQPCGQPDLACWQTMRASDVRPYGNGSRTASTQRTASRHTMQAIGGHADGQATPGVHTQPGLRPAVQPAIRPYDVLSACGQRACGRALLSWHTIRPGHRPQVYLPLRHRHTPQPRLSNAAQAAYLRHPRRKWDRVLENDPCASSQVAI